MFAWLPTQSAVKYALLMLPLGAALALSAPVEVTSTGFEVKQAEAKSYKVKRYKKPAAPKKTIDDLIVEQKQWDKWAAIVVDAKHGKILYEKNAESKRHPASLTKMMTLYLLFDALERGKAKPLTKMKVSKKAASQPQTNISLKTGQRITPRQAIPALIIRSANDVALVVAEHLGGSQAGFARMMNKKAKELGMVGTRFYNPHGLPDKRQVTTAMDMAKLSIAIRRDFPGYYHHFRKKSFRHNGKTYKSHNRVVGKYPGADGLKTGYIRMSGFNLATSVTRGSTRLIGVILGGKTGASRDQEMINMLDRTLVAMRSKKRRKGQVVADRKQVRQLPSIEVEKKPTVGETAPYLSGKNWAVQVGAFPTLVQAEKAAAAARKVAPEPLADAKLHISQVMTDNQIFNRSRMLYLTADQARSVCDQLASVRKQCIVIRMEN